MLPHGFSLGAQRGARRELGPRGARLAGQARIPKWMIYEGKWMKMDDVQTLILPYYTIHPMYENGKIYGLCDYQILLTLDEYSIENP